MDRLARIRRLAVRNRYDLGVWSLTAGVAVVGWTVAAFLGAPALALGGTVLAGAVRLAFEIGRRERAAGVREDLRGRAAEAVAAAAGRHVLHRTLWIDDAALEELKRRIIEGEPPPLVRPGVPDWKLDELVEAGEEALDIRAREDGDWLRISNELQRCHDDFAAAVGAYMPDLEDRDRVLVLGCLREIEASVNTANRAFVQRFAPERTTDEAMAETSRTFYGNLGMIYECARRLGAD